MITTRISRLNSTIVIIALTTALSFAIISNYYPNLFLVYAQQTIDPDNNSYNNIINLDNITSKQVKVGDIDISYKIFGKGDPILLITGYSGSMYSWDPIFLKEVSRNNTVIVFNNRGIDNTSVGSKNFTIEQFATDTAGLLDVLKINKSDILGFSMGGMIAQQLTIDYPNKVDDLIIYASTCGGTQSIWPNQQMVEKITDLSGSPEDIKKRFIPLLFTENWIKQNPDYIEKFASVQFPPVDILQKQFDAIFSWKGTCDQLDQISQDTLVVAGTNDHVLPYANSIMLVEKISGAWLVQFKDGGHGLMFQYPERLSTIVNTFLHN